MPNTLQEFLGAATQKASTDLVTAFLQIPEDKRGWSPAETARTGLDVMAECAILNGYTADLIQTRQWSTRWFEEFPGVKSRLAAAGWEAIQALLEENTGRLAAAIQAVSEDALQEEIALPWGKQALAQMLAYPYWNMSYHQGQVNYLASILGCLK